MRESGQGDDDDDGERGKSNRQSSVKLNFSKESLNFLKNFLNNPFRFG